MKQHLPRLSSIRGCRLNASLEMLCWCSCEIRKRSNTYQSQSHPLQCPYIRGRRSAALQSKVIIVLARRTLRDPEKDSREHHRYVLRNVGIAVVGELVGVPAEDVFKD